MLQPTATIATGTIGFHWGDAGIAAAATLGIVLLIGGLGVTLMLRIVHRVSFGAAALSIARGAGDRDGDDRLDHLRDSLAQ